MRKTKKGLGWHQGWCLEVHWRAMSSKMTKTQEGEESECDTFQVALRWQCRHVKDAVALDLTSKAWAKVMD